MRFRAALFSFASCFCFCSATLAATFDVTNTDDDSVGSLRQAIIAANMAASPPHLIRFAPSYPAQGTIELFTALPALTAVVEIDGMDRAPVIMPFNQSSDLRLLATNRALTLRRLSMSSGRAVGRGGCLSGEGISGSSTLLLDRMRFTGCTAVVSSGNAAANGGAVAWQSIAAVTIIDSVFEYNGAVSVTGPSAGGGAISTLGPLHIESSYFIGNIINGGSLAGGAVLSNPPPSAVVEIIDSVFVDNHAEPDAVASPQGLGGAININCTICSAQLVRNYFGGNRSHDGGALFLRGNNGPGSIAVTLHNSTLVDNAAAAIGGGFLIQGGQLNVRQTSFQGNRASSGGHVATFSSPIAEWSNSVLAAVANASAPACALDAVATIATGNHLQSGDSSCNAVLPGSAAAANLGVVGVDDGELMPVLVFDRASPVVDGGDASRCLLDDARSHLRPQDGDDDGVAHCDAGALELPSVRIFNSGFES